MILKIARWLEKIPDARYEHGYRWKYSYTYIDYIAEITWETIKYAKLKGSDLVEAWFNDRRIDWINRHPKDKPDDMDVIKITTHDKKGKLHLYVTDLDGWLLNDEGKTLAHIYKS